MSSRGTPLATCSATICAVEAVQAHTPGRYIQLQIEGDRLDRLLLRPATRAKPAVNVWAMRNPMS